MSFKKYLKENEEMEMVVSKAKSAYDALVHASLMLEEAQEDFEKSTGQRTTDFLDFKSRVDEIISSDGGEAGLESFIKLLEKD